MRNFFFTRAGPPLQPATTGSIQLDRQPVIRAPGPTSLRCPSFQDRCTFRAVVVADRPRWMGRGAPVRAPTCSDPVDIDVVYEASIVVAVSRQSACSVDRSVSSIPRTVTFGSNDSAAVRPLPDVATTHPHASWFARDFWLLRTIPVAYVRSPGDTKFVRHPAAGGERTCGPTGPIPPGSSSPVKCYSRIRT